MPKIQKVTDPAKIVTGGMIMKVLEILLLIIFLPIYIIWWSIETWCWEKEMWEQEWRGEDSPL